MIKISEQPSNKFTWCKTRDIRGIVIHTTEGKEITHSADYTAGWFRNPLCRASSHYIVDALGIVRCVADNNIAWHAGAVNNWTIGIELAGSATQTEAQWRDDYSLKVLDNTAQLVADLCAKYAIPAARIEGADILAKQRGIFGHVDANKALADKGGHFDPGPNFPWNSFIAKVQTCLESSATGSM